MENEMKNLNNEDLNKVTGGARRKTGAIMDQEDLKASKTGAISEKTGNKPGMDDLEASRARARGFGCIQR